MSFSFSAVISNVLKTTSATNYRAIQMYTFTVFGVRRVCVFCFVYNYKFQLAGICKSQWHQYNKHMNTEEHRPNQLLWRVLSLPLSLPSSLSLSRCVCISVQFRNFPFHTNNNDKGENSTLDIGHHQAIRVDNTKHLNRGFCFIIIYIVLHHSSEKNETIVNQIKLQCTHTQFSFCLIFIQQI